MKKIVILCMAVLLLSGCQTQPIQKNSTQDDSSVGDSGWNNITGSPSLDNESDSTSNSSKTELDLSGFQRNMNVNSPLRLPTACKTEKGYYLQNEGLLYFFDYALGKMIVVCGKPECPHNDNDCNAWINSKLLSYYDGKLYYTNCDAIHNSYTTFCSMNLDGTNHTDVQIIQIAEPGPRFNCADPVFVNGIIYFMEPDHSVYRVGLGQKVENAVMLIGGEPENMIQISEWKLWGDGDKAYAMNRYMDNNGNEHDRLYLLGGSAANTREIWSSQQMVNSLSGDASWYIMNGQLYYYLSGSGLWSIDLSSGKSEKISLSGNINGGMATFTDENIIVLNSDGKELMVFDYNGAVKADIDLSSIYRTYFDIAASELVFADGGSAFMLAYHEILMSPSSALYQIDWGNGRIREIDTWPAANMEFSQDGNEYWIEVGKFGGNDAA